MPYAGTLHRKPIPKPGISMRPPQPYSHPGPTDPYQQMSNHSRTRTSSSGVFPIPSASPTTYTPPGTMHSQYPSQYPPQQQQQQQQQQQLAQGTRRTLSNATSSTSSTTGTPNRSNSGTLRRSSSSRSGSSPTSYVALMRKQKATVWCDRAQYEDPRILAAQRAAKMRANMEVAGGPHHGAPRASSSSSGVAAGVRSKITHRAPKASLYAPGNLAGTGVPMRLSASEVDEGDSEDGASVGGTKFHQRTGSGRSSLGSGRRVAYAGSGAGTGARMSSNSTPPEGVANNEAGMADLVEEETPATGYNAGDYLEHTGTGLYGRSGSASSGERQFGDVGQMPRVQEGKQKEKKGADDLHRRGSVMSVDERTMTMSGTRLFIANPDLSD
ncbi:uncharacterized protein EI97DRAFT_451728 [Westerdykella ornata]|uniref:Uncharacterized protein n=1 Tax=Westerdykella ornata TaxID=318751 RepID=A0A6A6JDP9_WESOR|nr:uncharacterized protein EI97DRAFT_451728 [Westerdykella ornata]KAF2274407.1 hypothetical protein EI97DRAFT_451728 [Westerdykella ornata]